MGAFSLLSLGASAWFMRSSFFPAEAQVAGRHPQFALMELFLLNLEQLAFQVFDGLRYFGPFFF
jgi:hypothetical protein